MQNNFLGRLFWREVPGVDHYFCILRFFIRVRDSSELFQDSRPRLRIQALAVALLANPKHPPLSAWPVWLWFQVFPYADWAYYLLCMVLATFALWVAWKISTCFLSPEKAVAVRLSRVAPVAASRTSMRSERPPW